MKRLVAVLSAVLVAAAAGPAAAAVVVVANATDQEVRLTLLHPGAEPRSEVLPAWEGRPFAVGREPVLALAAGGKADRYRLEPYSAYVVTRAPQGVALQGIELAGPMPRPDDVAARPPDAWKPVRLTVRLFADDADPRPRPRWEAALRQRVAAASEVLERQCGVALDVAAVGEWNSDPEVDDLRGQLADFERKVKPAPARVALGFISRPLKTTATEEKGQRKRVGNVGCTRGPAHPYVLLREGHPKTEPERVEVLVHELGHHLGAAHSPDPASVMRARLGDGKAAAARFRVGFDPLNLLAIGIWAEEARGGRGKSWADLRPVALDRLRVIYKTLAHATPDDPVAGEYVGVIDRLREPPEVAGPADPPVPVVPDPGKKPDDMAPPKPKEPARPAYALTPKQEAVRKVVRAVAVRSGDLRRVPDGADRPKGDRLTAEYVRSAADVAVTLEDDLQAPAFLLGLGIALDDSTVLRDNPVTRELCRAVESDGERRERLAVLGVPTVRYRRDLCQHFAVSAALVEILGPAGAEAVGMTKEVLDMQGTSGFSFADLAADFAGVAFARKVKADRGVLTSFRDGFRVEDFVPSVAGLRDGVPAKRFEADFGSATDPRFAAAVKEVRKRVAETPAYKK